MLLLFSTLEQSPLPYKKEGLVLTFAILGEDDHARVPEAAPGGCVAAAQVLHDEALRDGGAQIVGLRRRPHELVLPELLAAHPGP